jgi:hypothetical protein
MLSILPPPNITAVGIKYYLQLKGALPRPGQNGMSLQVMCCLCQPQTQTPTKNKSIATATAEDKDESIHTATDTVTVTVTVTVTATYWLLEIMSMCCCRHKHCRLAHHLRPVGAQPSPGPSPAPRPPTPKGPPRLPVLTTAGPNGVLVMTVGPLVLVLRVAGPPG